MSQLATSQDTAKAVGRPLKVLVPMIKTDLMLGGEAAESAAMPYYKAAGEKLIEAKPQMKHGEFGPWIKKNFGISDSRARLYMTYARATSGNQNGRGRAFSSMQDFERRELGRDVPNKVKPQPWHEPIKESLGKVDPSKYEDRANAAAEEHRLRRDLAFQLIDIGFKALATKLHPDKGGSREAMTRLNAVRAKLRACAQK